MTLQGLDQTFQAVLIIGYHSGAGAGKSPLEHTYSGNVWRIRLNGKEVSEFLIDAHTAAYVGVPLVFASGDRGLCEHATSLVPGITTVAVKEGSGASTINIHPSRALERIRTSVAHALQGDVTHCHMPLPDHFELEVEFRSQARAFQYGFFPGVCQTGPCTVRLETHDYFDVPRFLMFAV